MLSYIKGSKKQEGALVHYTPTTSVAKPCSTVVRRHALLLDGLLCRIWLF